MSPTLINVVWFLLGAGVTLTWRWPWFPIKPAVPRKLYVVLYRYEGEDTLKVRMSLQRSMDDAYRFMGRLAVDAGRDKPSGRLASCEMKVVDLI